MEHLECSGDEKDRQRGRKMTTKELARSMGLVRKPLLEPSQPSNKAKACQPFAYVIVIDFEATCWKEKKLFNYAPEIIEFPAVLLNTATGSIESEFHMFVQPSENPRLSGFCTELTGITQAQVDDGVPIGTCLLMFSRWLQKLKQEFGIAFHCEHDQNKENLGAAAKWCTFITWSDWDFGICLKNECIRKQLRCPRPLRSWIDLRATYKNFYSRKPQGLAGALQDLGISFSGRQHSGLDDARNTAKLAWRMVQDGCVLIETKALDRPVRSMPYSANRKDQARSSGRGITHDKRDDDNAQKVASGSRKSFRGGPMPKDRDSPDQKDRAPIPDKGNNDNATNTASPESTCKQKSFRGGPMPKDGDSLNQKDRAPIPDKRNYDNVTNTASVRTCTQESSRGGPMLKDGATGDNLGHKEQELATQMKSGGQITGASASELGHGAQTFARVLKRKLDPVGPSNCSLISPKVSVLDSGALLLRAESRGGTSLVTPVTSLSRLRTVLGCPRNLASCRAGSREHKNVLGWKTGLVKQVVEEATKTVVGDSNPGHVTSDERAESPSSLCSTKECYKQQASALKTPKGDHSSTLIAKCGMSRSSSRIRQPATASALSSNTMKKQSTPLGIFCGQTRGPSGLSCSSGGKATPPLCHCGRRSRRKAAVNPGPNQGRVFFTCPQNYRQISYTPVSRLQQQKRFGCEFFCWAS